MQSGESWLRLRTNPKTGVDILYKERPPQYAGTEDQHDFWELLYVDKGYVKILLDQQIRTVSDGEFLLIAPRRRHSILSSGSVAPFFITAHFETNIEHLEVLADAVFRGNEQGRQLLIHLLREKASDAFGADALVCCYLVEFLVNAVRGAEALPSPKALTPYFQDNAAVESAEKAMKFMKANFHRSLTLREIADASCLSPSHLSHLFKKKTGSSVMGFLEELRIQHAKTLLLESGLNVSQIAEQIGYSSIHLFSRRFKKFVSVSPARYARMVRLALGPDSANG
jgi:AraC-like DNA-binding protein/mannose-6-phosphate isomerase-like protein (cupin superfamily)